MVLVSILGDFHSSILPIFFEFKDKITHHIILHDDSSHDKKHIKRLMKAQKNFLETYEAGGISTLNYKINRLELKEDNYKDIQNAFKMIASIVQNSKDIYLNATDGLSSIAIILSNKILQYGGNVIAYDRYSNTYNIHTKNRMKKKNIKNNMDIKNHLKLKGYNLKSWTNALTLKKRKTHIKEITKNLTKFKKFANGYRDQSSTNTHYLTLIKKMGKRDMSFVEGGIFEEYIYWLIKDNIEIDDIMVGVHIEFEKDVNNEVDILFIKDNHLHTIECKFSKNFGTSLHLYKIDSVMDYIDDDGKGMILTVSNKKIGYQDEARAYNDNINFYAVEYFDEKNFLDEVKVFFNLGAK